MKANIHPKWNHQTPVKCACGNTFETGSSLEMIEVDICSQCHPFFTGEMRFVDIQGRVDRFKSRQQMAASLQDKKKSKKKTAADDTADQASTKSLKELLSEERDKLKKTEAETTVQSQ